MPFAARDFSPRRGVSDEHIPQWICKERATKSGRKRPAALRVAPNLACGFVARRLQSHVRGMRPPRASPQAKLGATNVIVFMPQTTKFPKSIRLGADISQVNREHVRICKSAERRSRRASRGFRNARYSAAR